MINQKIAVTSEDGVVIGQHFGRTPYFVIFTIEDGQVTNRELRSNTFTSHMQGSHKKQNHQGQGQGKGQGVHSCGAGVAKGLADCQVLICGGIGQGAINLLQNAGMIISPTNLPNVDDSLNAYLNGQLAQDVEACKDHKH